MAVYSIWAQSAESFATTAFTGTLATEFSLSAGANLTGIWVYSPSGISTLPAQCAIYDIDTSSLVSGTLNTSPSWSGAAGSGWVKCTYSGPSLASGTNYATAVFYSATVPYAGYTWPTTNGIIEGTAGLYTTGGSGVQLPGSNAGGFTYWIDVEVTTSSGVTATLGLGMAPMALSAAAAETVSGHFGLGMAPMGEAFTAAETGTNVTSHFGLGMGAMAMRFRQHRPGAGLAARDSEESAYKKRLLLWDV